MHKKCRALLLLLVLMPLWLTSVTALAGANKCSEVFGNIAPGSQTQAQQWANLYKSSDLIPRPQLWLRIRQALQKNVTHLEHPLESAGQDPDKIGTVFKRLTNELPVLRTLLQLLESMDKGRVLSHAEFIQIKRPVANQLIAISRAPHSDLQVFAALEALRVLATIESRVEFPKSQEEIQKEKEEEKKQEEEQKKEKKKDQEKEEEEESEPQWNQAPDKYKPENKDVSNEGKGKQKNVDLVLTDAHSHQGLFRQRIYDQFDLLAWSSVPVGREPLQVENKFTKRLILDPLGGTDIDVPVPYGYSLIPGKYPDHKIIEVGPGEFKVQVNTKNPVTLGLARIQRDSALSFPPRIANAKELAHWPAHLLLFTQSLKGLPPLEAASRLEEYISKEGGFLYYSKGDKISKEQLTKIDEKLAQLLGQMPKPMAMANVGAFNCDGAAWIGALLLRDVLGLQVRIVGGRTSEGTKIVNQEKLSVIKSADPAHSWIEVFDGKHWIPFDMTPKTNTPESDSAPADVEREETEQKEADKKPPAKEDGKPKPGTESKAEKTEADKSGEKEEDKKDEQASKEMGDKEEKDAKGKDKDKDKTGKDDKDETKETEAADQDNKDTPRSKKIDDLIDAKSTQRLEGEKNLGLIERVIKRNELVFLEHLIQAGHQTEFQVEANSVLDALNGNSNWKNVIERSRGKIATLINDAKFAKFQGLQNLLAEVRLEFTKNNPREAKQKLIIVQRLLLALSEYRSLTKQETESLQSIERILRILDQIKHENSKEYEAVQELLKGLPGNLSKSWLAKQYGKDYDQLGSAANIKLGQDIVSGKLKPLLQMAAVNDFVDMTLNSTPEPQWKDEPTLDRSFMPKPRQDLIITRSPLDFAKMLWTLRPGEHMFAPTLQGRQFAMGSLETRRVENPKNSLEKKVSVIYYDISGSMAGKAMESQDALLMAFVDKALSETDAIGRPTHEIYLIPFEDNVRQGVHIASREDALNFLSRRMNMRTEVAGGTDIQKAVEHFYDIIGASYKNKSAQGREKRFKKANMVLFSDGGSQINMKRLEDKRKELEAMTHTRPNEILISMNFVNIGDQVNDQLKLLSENGNLASGKPMFRKMDSAMLEAIQGISSQYSPDAFATTQRMSGNMIAELNNLLKNVSLDARQPGNAAFIDRALSQVEITKTDVRHLTGLRETLNLTQIVSTLEALKVNSQTRQRLFESIIESYPQLTGRTWKDMTYPEKDALEKLRAWTRSTK